RPASSSTRTASGSKSVTGSSAGIRRATCSIHATTGRGRSRRARIRCSCARSANSRARSPTADETIEPMTAGVDWLTPEDARILALEGPVVAGHTCKVIRLAPDGAELSLDELRSQIARRLDRAPRLRRRLDVAAAPLAQPAWVDDQR